MEKTAFLFYSDFHLIGWGPFIFERAICFIWSTKSHVNCIQKHSQRCIQKNVWPNIQLPMAQASWHKINHPNFSETYTSNELFTMSTLILHRYLKFNLSKKSMYHLFQIYPSSIIPPNCKISLPIQLLMLGPKSHLLYSLFPHSPNHWFQQSLGIYCSCLLLSMSIVT